MSGLSIEVFANDDLKAILDADEQVIWSGRPEYGRRFFQPIGAERIALVCVMLGIVAMWGTLPFIPPDPSFGRAEAIWVYSAVSLGLALVIIWAAYQRQTVLCTLLYFLTDKRSIVCRRGRNWHLGTRLYVVSNRHSATYPYQIVPTRPNPSLRIGTILDKQELNPFGFGLSHPGQPVPWGLLTVPVTFEQIPDARALLDMIKSALPTQG